MAFAKRALSAFDLDHTLLKGNGSVQFGLHLYRQGFFNTYTLFHLFTAYTALKIGVSSIERLHNAVFSRVMQGKDQGEIREQVSQFIKKILNPLLYPPVLQRLKAAQAAGHYTLLLSSSPDFLVKDVARSLNVDQCLGSRYSVDAAGRFSHIAEVLHSDHKAACVRATAKQLAIPKECITVYSDSYSDLSFLQEAGRAVAVRPDKRLRTFSQKMHWEIIH